MNHHPQSKSVIIAIVFIIASVLMPLQLGGRVRNASALTPAAVGDVETGSWSSSDEMAVARYYHSSTLLPNGQILVAGGVGIPNPPGTVLSGAELFSPATKTWSATGSMITPRLFHTATLLQNGKVLVAGGIGANSTPLDSAELYDPATGTWAATGSMTCSEFIDSVCTISGRKQFSAQLLPDGRVLAAGGAHYQTPFGPFAVLSTAELYDPDSGTWSATMSMAEARWNPVAAVLPTGKVLVAGGADSNTAELYDPETGNWSATGSMAMDRWLAAAALLSSGKVLVTGGAGAGGANDPQGSAELYDYVTGAWSATGSMIEARYEHTATLLANGEVLVTGGSAGNTNIAELYSPGTGTWSSAGAMSSTRWGHTAVGLADGTAIIIAGSNIAGVLLASADLYTPAGVTPPDPTSDLAVVNVVTATEPLCAGDTVTFSSTIRNNGTADSGFFGVVQSTSDNQFQSGLHPSLAGGASNTITGTFTMPAEPGAFTVTVWADPESVIAESDEDNNQRSVTFEVEKCTPHDIYYFGLGDSIAAGHGLDNDRNDPCRRSDQYKYSNIVSDQLKALYGDSHIHAYLEFSCSGATAAGKVKGKGDLRYKTLAGQVAAVKTELTKRDAQGNLLIPADATVLVSITIGANDFKFADEQTFEDIVKMLPETFNRTIQRRNDDAKLALMARINDLRAIRADVNIVLTELYNPFNPSSVFFGRENRRVCGWCYGRTEQAINLWNTTQRSIAAIPAYQGHVVVTQGMQAAFYAHRSPGGAGILGGFSYEGGGCGKTGPEPQGVLVFDPDPRFINETWIQYRNDPESWSFSVPHDIGNGDRNDPLIFHDIFRTRNEADAWRGDCFHPNRRGVHTIAEFVFTAVQELLGEGITAVYIPDVNWIHRAA